MSVAKHPKPRKKTDRKVQIFCHEAQNVGSKHKDDVDESQSLHQPKQTSSLKDRINNNILSTKKKEFVIPRKKKQAKELLQSHRFDSRETKELLRSVQLSLRDPSFWSSYKFERVELVNNDKLARKYGDKKQALRLETMRTNRELEDRFAFLFTTSRTEVKSVCEHGLHTGNSSLTSLGDPKLGVYLCRYSDVIYKRPLTTEDSGYLLVFRVVKGKVRFIGGNNPELQPTPHHDCHVSKSLTTLSSKASYSDVFESSQLYFYEIDENSDDFHVKQPRQVLPYAVLTFTILKPEQQQSKLDEKSEGKKAVVTGHDSLSSADENILYSPNRIESKDDLISNANVSWSGVLAINKKQFAYVDFLSYSRKKHPLPVNVDYFNISHKVSHDDLRSLLKCPVFRNGKPASSGVCIELNHGRKFIYYEVRVVNQIQDKFDALVSHFVNNEMAGVIEYQYFKGPVYLYLIPTSKLTNDIGITDRKSPLALHALLQLRHVRRLPNAQENTVPTEHEQEQDAGIDDTSLSEVIIESQVQEIFMKKYEDKQEKLHRKTKQDTLTPLMTRRTSLEDGENTTDQPKSVLEARRKSTDVGFSLPPEGASHEKRVQFQKEARKWVDSFFSSVRKERGSNMQIQDSPTSSNTPTRKSKYKWVNPKSLDKQSLSLETELRNDDSMKTSRNEKENLPSSKDSSNVDQGTNVKQAPSTPSTNVNQDLGRKEGIGVVSVDNTADSSLQSANMENQIDFITVQKLIKEFQHHDKQCKTTVSTRSSALVDPRLQKRSSSSSSQDINSDKPGFLPSIPPPPIPPPPPPPFSPFLSTTLLSSSVVGNTPVFKTSTSEPSTAATDVPLVTSPVSPPAVKRQEMLIPGLEPTGSPVFQLMREKISFMNQSINTSASYLKDSRISTQSVTAWNQMHPSSPITISSSDNTPTRTIITPVSISNSKSCTTRSENREHGQELQTRRPYSKENSPKIAQTPPDSNNDISLEKCAAQNDMLHSDIPDIPDYDNIVINRPLTEAEKNSSRAIREIKNILLRNRDVSKDTSSEEDNNNDEHCTDYQSGISRNVGVENTALKHIREDKILPKERLDEPEYSSTKPKEHSKKENKAKDYAVKGRGSATENRYVNERDGRNVDERNVCHEQPMKKLLLDRNTSVETPGKRSLKSDSACSSPSTPELKSGLDLLDNLLSCQKRGHQPSPLSKFDLHRYHHDHRGTSSSERRSKSRSRETTPRKERSDEERKKISPSRKRKVTIKRSNTTVNDNKWDDMTSDISDTELPLDSDGYSTENHRIDGYRDYKSSTRSKDVSRPSSHDRLELSHHHDRFSTERTSPRRTVNIAPKRDSSIDTHRGYRDDHEDWDRKRKRRKLDQDQAREIPEPLLQDNESIDSDSAMSISSLDSVAFEYAVPNEESSYNRYRFVRTSPINGRSLEVTITRDIECPDTFPGHTNPDDCGVDTYHTQLIPPSSPTEVDMTAMPNSPGTPETAVPSEGFLHTNIGYWSTGCATKEGADIFPQDIVPTQQENIQDSTYDQGTWSAPSSPYRGCDDDHDVTGAGYKREELVVKKSRGEGHCQRRHSSSGGSTGYDYNNTSYKDRNQKNNPDYYRHNDGHSLRASNQSAPYTDNDYDNLRDLNDNYPHRYPHTSDRYDDQGDHGLFCASRSPYKDIDSPHSIDFVEELGSNERYYTSDGTDSYSNIDRRASPLHICERFSADRRGTIDDDYGLRSPTNSDGPLQYDYSEWRERSDHDYRRRGIITNDGQPSQYSPEKTSEIIDDGYRHRSPLAKNNRTSQYSPKRSRTTGDEYRRGSRSPLINNDRHSQYPSSWRGVSDDGYKERSSLEKCSYSSERRKRSPIAIAERRSSSPDRGKVTDNNYRQRSSFEHNELRSQYSPDQRGVSDGSYGQKSPPITDDRRSSYSAYQREVSDDKYDQRLPSPVDINNRPSCYSPERTPISDGEYGEYYEASGSEIEPGREFNEHYQNDKDFPPDIEEKKDFHADVYQNEEQQDYLSEDEDNGIDRQPRYTYDNVEPSYGSDIEGFEHDGVDTPEYYDKEQHKYLEDIVENNNSLTTLALDQAVFDGIRDFPVQLFELAKYLNDISKTSSNGEVVSNADGTVSSVNSLAVSRDPRLNKGLSNVSGGKGSANRTVTEAGRKRKSGDHKKIVKPIQKKQSCFYVYNPDSDPECEAVKHYMLKTGAQFLDVSDENNLNTMTGELRVLVRRKHRPSIHRISNLVKMKLRTTVKFALFNTVEDVSKKTRAYAAIFQYGGVLIPDDAILRTVDPALLEALLRFMAEENAMHQKFYWVMNIRYIAYKKLGSQRPLTWRDAFVLDLLRKYRNERFVNIINKDYVLENLSPVQRYLDTALKQQLELMPTYRHFILLSDLNKQTVEVSWFFNRGIGFMDVKEWLHLFAGEAKTQQLLSASKYTKDGSEYTAEGTRQDTIQYDTIDSPEDDESIEPSSMPVTTTHISTESLKRSHEGHRQRNHLSRSLSHNMVSRSTNYRDDSNMKEKRLEILSSINNVKTNLMNNMGAKGVDNKAKEDCVGIQNNVAKQRKYGRSRSHEPHLGVRNERVMPRWTDNHQTYDTTKTLDKNGLPDLKEAQNPKALYEKRNSYHGNDRHNSNINCKGTIQSTFS